jgi:hypothetical protein
MRFLREQGPHSAILSASLSTILGACSGSTEPSDDEILGLQAKVDPLNDFEIDIHQNQPFQQNAATNTRQPGTITLR